MTYQAKYKKRLEIIEEIKELVNKEIDKTRFKKINQNLLMVWNNLLRLEAWN